VVFETGLFLGTLGKQRVFMVVDSRARVKVPSDFDGIIRFYYDSSLLGKYARQAVSTACDEIAQGIRQLDVPVPPSLGRLEGKWKSRFAAGPFKDHPITTDDVEITVTAKGIHLTGNSRGIPYTGEGLVYYHNQIIGNWKHPQEESGAKGLFMLWVNTIADAMYGYCTSQDANGRFVFGKWVFAKNNGSDEQIFARLIQAQRHLEESTIGPALG
jgi:Predicted nucleotide-binding protein containing TIR-like domain